MFQSTSAYGGWLGRWLAPWLLAWVAVSSLSPLVPAGALRAAASGAAEIAVAAGVVAFAVATLDLQRRRRRRRRDVTLSFWRLGMVLLILAALLSLALGLFDPMAVDPALRMLPAALFLVGFVVSVINGMLYEFVPFLVRLHLQARASAAAPNMKQVIPDRWARRHYVVHVAALAVLAAALVGPDPLRVAAGVLWGASMLFLWLNLGRAVAVYRRGMAGGGPGRAVPRDAPGS